LYGTGTVIENLAVQQRVTFQYRLRPILAALGITREQLFEFYLPIHSLRHQDFKGQQ